MKKKKKILSKILTFSGLLLGASSVIIVNTSSQTTANYKSDKLLKNSPPLVKQQNGETGGTGTGGEEKPKPKPKVPDPNFDKFKDVLSNTVSTEIPKLASLLKQAIEVKKKAIDENKELTKEQAWTQLLYLKYFEQYLTKIAAAKTLSELDAIGIRSTLLKLLSTDKSVDLKTIKYQGKEYPSVGIGATNDTNYGFITTDPKVKDDKGEEIPNTISPLEPPETEVNDVDGVKFSNTAKSYYEDLAAAATSVFMNDADFPVNGVDLDLKIDSKDGVIGVLAPKPKNFDSWDDYIKSKINTRATEFDLAKNQEYFKKDSQDNPQPKPENPEVPIPPEIDDLLPQPSKPVPVSPAIENVPALNVYLNPSVGKSKFDDDFESFVKNYTQGSADQIKTKSDFSFYFFNPINTRFDYTVTNITVKDDDFVATVKITDKLNPAVSRTYQKVIENDKRDFYEAFADYRIYLRMRQQFIALYDIMGIKEVQDYNKLLDTGIRQDLFNAIFLAVKTFSSETTFENEKNQIISSYANNPNFQESFAVQEDLNKNPYIKSLDKSADELLSKYLEARGIDTNGFTSKDKPRTFWEVLGQSLEYAINGLPFKVTREKPDGSKIEVYAVSKLKQNLENSEFKPKIQKLLNDNNFDLEKFDEGFSKLQKNAVIIKENSSANNISFENRKEELKNVFDGFINFASLFPIIEKTDEKPSEKPIEKPGEKPEETPDVDKAKSKEAITKTLQDLKAYIDKNNTVDNKTVIIILVLSIIAALVAAGAITLTFVAIKKNKISKKSIVTISVTGIFAIASVALAIAMIILLLGGI